jgi:hypothetical protein
MRDHSSPVITVMERPESRCMERINETSLMGNGLAVRYRSSSLDGDIAGEIHLLPAISFWPTMRPRALSIVFNQTRTFLQMLQQIAFS